MAKKARIMIVDDDRSVRRLVSKKLQKAGYDVYSLEDGMHALIEIDRAPPDLLISDINMPFLDGLKLAHSLRNHPTAKDLPIIFLTSSKTSHNIAQSVLVRAKGFLNKPVDDEVLLELVARTLGS